MTKKVYLGGPIQNCTDSEVHDWRENVKEIFVDKDYICFDPTVRFFRGKKITQKEAADIVTHDLYDLSHCDIGFFNCWKQNSPMWGTAMEIRYAYEQGIEVYIVLPEFTPTSPWLMYHGAIYYGTPEQLARLL